MVATTQLGYVLRALNNNAVAKVDSVNLHSLTVDCKHEVHMTGLEQNKTYTFEVASADGTPLVLSNTSRATCEPGCLARDPGPCILFVAVKYGRVGATDRLRPWSNKTAKKL
jgi:hypothetical protein